MSIHLFLQRGSKPMAETSGSLTRRITTCSKRFSTRCEGVFSPEDFRVGEEVMLMGRRFLLCDCEDFSRKHYEQIHPDILLKPLTVDTRTLQDIRRVKY